MPLFQPESAVQTWAEQVTTDEYADLGAPWDTRWLLRKSIVVKNTGGTNGLHYKVLGSVDNGKNYDVEIKEETVVAAEQSDDVSYDKYVTHVKIQVKAQSASDQTTAAASAAGIGA